MPQVGKKHYSYSKKGMAQAKKAAKKMGMPVRMKTSYKPKKKK
mgnify:FL=1